MGIALNLRHFFLKVPPAKSKQNLVWSASMVDSRTVVYIPVMHLYIMYIIIVLFKFCPISVVVKVLAWARLFSLRPGTGR